MEYDLGPYESGLSHKSCLYYGKRSSWWGSYFSISLSGNHFAKWHTTQVIISYHVFTTNGIIVERSGWKHGSWQGKRPRFQQKEKHKCLFLCCILTLFFQVYPQGYQQAKNNLASLGWECECLSIDLIIYPTDQQRSCWKFGQEILSCDLMGRECNYSLPSKVNSKMRLQR